MWQEITKQDIGLIEDFIRVQSPLSEYYKLNMTMESCLRDLDINALRAFIYRDKDHEINLATILLKDGVTMQLRTVGVGKSVDMNLALDPILFSKIKEVMGEYGATAITAIYAKQDVLPQIEKFYDGISNGLVKKGFDAVPTNPKQNIVKFVGPLIDASKDEVLDPIPDPKIDPAAKAEPTLET